jgi:hypothetical protein
MRMKFLLAALLICAALLSIASMVLAQTTDGYDLSWYTIDGGGGILSGGGYVLNATTGQSDAGQLTGSGYTLKGGFWSLPMPGYVYLPIVTR